MKQQKQIVALVALLAAAVGAWYWQSYTPSAGSKEREFSFAQSYQPLNFPNPTIRFDKVAERRKAEYKGQGVNPFSTIVPPSPAEIKKTADDAAQAAEARAKEPPLPPPPPQLPGNLKFFGYGSVPNNAARRAFLEDGDEVYIVNEGDTLLGRFRILKINNASIDFEEVGSGRRGQKMLEDQGPA